MHILVCEENMLSDTCCMSFLKKNNNTRWTKRNAHETETFVLFGKMFKKLIITSVSIIDFIIMQ